MHQTELFLTRSHILIPADRSPPSHLSLRPLSSPDSAPSRSGQQAPTPSAPIPPSCSVAATNPTPRLPLSADDLARTRCCECGADFAFRAVVPAPCPFPIPRLSCALRRKADPEFPPAQVAPGTHATPVTFTRAYTAPRARTPNTRPDPDPDFGPGPTGQQTLPHLAAGPEEPGPRAQPEGILTRGRRGRWQDLLSRRAVALLPCPACRAPLAIPPTPLAPPPAPADPGASAPDPRVLAPPRAAGGGAPGC